MPEPMSLIADNIGYLQQALALLLGLSDELYSAAVPLAFQSSVGAHVRHCVEHYESFIGEWRTGQIDYDARPRDVRLERERTYAIKRIEADIAALQQMPRYDAEHPLRVKHASNAEHGTVAAWSRSSVPRELQFLVSHTVHHYALIAMMLRLQGCEPSADFGVAPSTLKHRQAGG